VSRREPAGCRRVADVGTGSGAIAVTLACEFEDVQVLASDRSRHALKVATSNAVRHGVRDRVCPLQSDLMSSARGELDAVVANLPYIPSADIAGLSPEVSLYEPRLALDGGADGLDLIRRLCSQASRVLADGGWLLLEVGDGQADDMRALLADQRTWHSLATACDLRGIRRVVTAVRNDR
jgi:release factor glutamine methyltransferase